MKILPTAQNLHISCPRCGNTVFPDGTGNVLILCPVIGCGHSFRLTDLAGYLQPPAQQNLESGATVLQGDGSVSPLKFGRNDMGEFIVTGVSGSPTSITVPAMVNGLAVMGIGPGAFKDQAQLRRVTLPDTVSVIDVEAFAGCTALQSVTFGKGLTLLDNQCFQGCTALDSVIIPAKVTEIGTDAFAGCIHLTHVELLGQVHLIRDGAFCGCSELAVFTYPARPARVDPGAFAACYALPQTVQEELFSSNQ